MNKHIATLALLIILLPSNAQAIDLGGIAKDIAGDVINTQKDALQGEIEGQLEGLKDELGDDLKEAMGLGGDSGTEGKTEKTYPEKPKPGKVTSNDTPLVFGGRYHKLTENTKFSSYKKTKKKKFKFKNNDLPKKIWE